MGLGQQAGQSLDEILPIRIVEKDIALLDAAYHHMLEKSGSIQPGESWQGVNLKDKCTD